MSLSSIPSLLAYISSEAARELPSELLSQITDTVLEYEAGINQIARNYMFAWLKLEGDTGMDPDEEHIEFIINSLQSGPWNRTLDDEEKKFLRGLASPGARADHDMKAIAKLRAYTWFRQYSDKHGVTEPVFDIYDWVDFLVSLCRDLKRPDLAIELSEDVHHKDELIEHLQDIAQEHEQDYYRKR